MFYTDVDPEKLFLSGASGSYPAYGYAFNPVPGQEMTDSPYTIQANHHEV